MHFHRRQLGEDVGHLFQLDPVVLDVLARAEVAVAAVVLGGDVAEHAQLVGTQVAVWDRHAQHVGVALVVQAVLQAQRQELFFRQFARNTAAHLVAELRNAVGDEAVIVSVVLVHDCSVHSGWRRRAIQFGESVS